MTGPSAIPESEIRAYFKNRGITPDPWELDIIERLDSIALELAAKESQTDGDDNEG